jgi:enoyl-CoA hydratase/carnithine racemase
VVLRGAGLKAFCAGGDIRAMREAYLAGGPSPQAHINFFIDEYRLDYQLQRYKKPIIALLDGIVMGGGMGLAQGAPFRLVGPKTKMAMPETAIGLFPDVGGSHFMSRTPTGLFLALTGQVIGAADAIHANLASYYLEPEALIQFIRALEQHQFSDDHFDAIAQLLMPFVSTAPPSSIMPKDAPIEGLADYEEAIEKHFSFDKSLNEIIDSLHAEKDERLQDWAELQLKVIAKRSPTSLRVTHAGVLRGKQLTLAECFRMELGIVTQCFAAGDVLEGIRALVVDKDHHPKWNPATLQEVDENAIAQYFINTYPSGQHPLGDLETQFGE